MRVLACAALLLAGPPAASFEAAPGGRIVAAPQMTNARIEEVIVRCRPDFAIGVVTPGGRLRPKRERREEEALFDVVFGRAAAIVDGERYELGVGGGSGRATLYLFAKDADALLAALRAGERLTLAFDILPERAKNGAGLETVATFDLSGLAAKLEAAGPACRTRPDD